MNSKFRLTGSGWAIVLLAATALALGGCGRKGGLDLPPTASGAAPADTEGQAAHKSSVFGSSFGTETPPAAPAPKGNNKKPFILDPLLDK